MKFRPCLKTLRCIVVGWRQWWRQRWIRSIGVICHRDRRNAISRPIMINVIEKWNYSSSMINLCLIFNVRSDNMSKDIRLDHARQLISYLYEDGLTSLLCNFFLLAGVD